MKECLYCGRQASDDARVCVFNKREIIKYRGIRNFTLLIILLTLAGYLAVVSACASYPKKKQAEDIKKIETKIRYLYLYLPFVSLEKAISTPANQLVENPTPTTYLLFIPTASRYVVIPEPTVRAQEIPMVQPTASPNCEGGCTGQVPGCDIKGNVSYETGEKIYHVPGGEFYNKTVINPDNGERWFCSESEALQAGWRRSKR